MKTWRLSLLCLPALLLASEAPVIEIDDPQKQARAAELLAPFKRELRSALQAGLQAGPLAALDACRLDAPEIAARHVREGVQVGRSSHKLRNPANAPADWLRPVLQDYVNGAARRPRLLRLPDGDYAYVEPITLQAPCLVCHGRQLDPEIDSRLRQYYPKDQATGFDPGDLRGVFWLRVSDDKLSSPIG